MKKVTLKFKTPGRYEVQVTRSSNGRVEISELENGKDISKDFFYNREAAQDRMWGHVGSVTETVEFYTDLFVNKFGFTQIK